MENNNIEYAKKILTEKGCTCVLYDGEQNIATKERGVAPLLKLLEQDMKLQGFSAADKVVGRAAAFLYVMLEIEEVYALVISKSALEVFDEYKVPVTYDKLVEGIRNRAGTGRCPMEEATLECKSPSEALIAVKDKLAQMRKQPEISK